jgi:hypothetical protein
MKKAFWKADWFLGLVIAIALFGFARMSGFIPGLERWAYDLGVKMTSKTPSDKVAVIAIDEQSIANIGRWPWPRDVQAKMIDQLAAAKAKVIGNTSSSSSPRRTRASRTSRRCSTSIRRPTRRRRKRRAGRGTHRRRDASRAGPAIRRRVGEIGKILAKLPSP